MSTADRFEVLSGGPDADAREARLVDGADELAAERGRSSILGNERFLLAAAAALMVLGLAVILVGWAGASRSTLVEEQVPYLISGGILGLGLTIIGALTLFSHWLTVGIREARAREAARQQDHDQLMGALAHLADALVQQEDPRNGRTRSARAERPVRRAPRSS